MEWALREDVSIAARSERGIFRVKDEN